jgi:hypothetical protein
MTSPAQGNEIANEVGSTLGPFDQVMDCQVLWASAEGVPATPVVTPEDSDAKPGEGFPLQPHSSLLP